MNTEEFLKKKNDLDGLVCYDANASGDTSIDIIKLLEEYHQTKLKLLGIADVSDCYSELQMKDCFEAGVYYERSIVNCKEAKKQKGARIVMGNDTPDFSEFMHRLNNR